ncbi:MAG: right-handed parallel beta-helix repeat-containing protein [Kiritimatiellaeota bacterium]|nr:right-handed parallel beta-helix repeat-containing protein [Kiritimatiellota bacterium]
MIKTRYLQWMLIGLGLALATPRASAVDRYVAPNGTGGGTSWTDAHSNLIAMVALAGDNDTVYVTNSAKYYLTNQITLSSAITVRSWGPGGIYDPTNTIIDACAPGTTNRHFTLTKYGAKVAGFTLTNGWGESDGNSNTASAGSIYLQSGIVTNCIIMRSYALGTNSNRGGGGIFLDGSGSGGVWNCTISANSARSLGGGIYVKSGGPWRIANCTISGNSILVSGGGIYTTLGTAGTIISNCWVVSNYSRDYVGGIFVVGSECHNSFIMGNTCKNYAGGGVRIYSNNSGQRALLRNCLVANNVSSDSPSSESGGGVAALGYSSIQNCTIASNAAPLGAGGLFIRSATDIQFENTIIWGNSGSGTYSNYYLSAGPNTFTNCCISPRIPGTYATEVNTITNDPRFVSTADFRLQLDSPCINAGINQYWMEGAQDLDGKQRIDNFRKTVDLGAYEFLGRGTLFKIH